ncbi:Rsd/AlgQ family anti-sigma factor [Shigella flexneri]
MRLNEKALDDFCQRLVDYLLPAISVFMNVLSINGRRHRISQRHQIWPQLDANTQLIIDFSESTLKTPSIRTTATSSQALSDIGEALEARSALEESD